jgi:preprotein translocase subunit YajC
MSLSFFQAVQPKTGTPGVSDQGGAPPSGGGSAASPPSMITMLLPFLILVPFLFLSFRRQKKEAAARSSLKKGDRVISGGLIGELVDLDDRVGKVKIAPGTTVQVLASTLTPFDPAPAAADKKKGEKDLEDLKEAKASASDKK